MCTATLVLSEEFGVVRGIGSETTDLVYYGYKSYIARSCGRMGLMCQLPGGRNGLSTSGRVTLPSWMERDRLLDIAPSSARSLLAFYNVQRRHTCGHCCCQPPSPIPAPMGQCNLPSLTQASRPKITPLPKAATPIIVPYLLLVGLQQRYYDPGNSTGCAIYLRGREGGGLSPWEDSRGGPALTVCAYFLPGSHLCRLIGLAYVVCRRLLWKSVQLEALVT